jgi:hypothetical protein
MSVGLVCILPRYKTTRVIYIYIYIYIYIVVKKKKKDFTNVANNKAGLSLLFGKNKWGKKKIFFFLHLVP